MKKLEPQMFINHKQTGAALIISLLILLVMTLIGVTAMQTTTMEERMAGNMNDQNIALQATEAAIRTAEAYIETQVNTNAFGTGHLYSQGNDPGAFTATTWTGTASTQITLTSWGLALEPRYYIEELGTIDDSANNTNINLNNNYTPSGNVVNKFRITARGSGLSDSSFVYIRTHYGKQF